MAILYGMARPSLTTILDGQERLLTFEPMSFQLETNADVAKSTKYNTLGQIVTAGSAVRSVESTLTMGVEAINWAAIQLAFAEIAETSTDVELPSLKFATLPVTGAQEINDVDIPADATKVSVAVYTDAKAQSLIRVSGVPATGQFAVTSGKITVGPGLEGAVIGYRVLLTVPTCETLGVEEVASTFTKLKFDGILTTDDSSHIYKISIPELSRETEPSINIEAPTRFDLTYTLITQAGKKRPFYLYKIPV